MQKEVLTIEKCKLDLMIPTYKSMKSPWWVVLLVMVPAALFFGLITLFIPSAAERAIVFGVYGAFLILIVLAVVADALSIRRKNRKIREAKIHVVQDVLVNTVDHFYFKPAIRRDDSGAHMLEFAKYGRYFISRRYDDRRGKYYKWSSLCVMNPINVYNTALPGDTFYLVIYDDDPEQKPVMVYNAKFFVYNEYKFYEES